MAYSLTGRKEEAQNIIEKYCKKKIPMQLTLEILDWWLKTLPFKNQSDKERLRALCLEAEIVCDISRSKSN